MKKCKKILVGLFSLIVFLSNVTMIQASSGDYNSFIKNEYTKLISNLTGEDYINAGNALNDLPALSQMNEESKDNYIRTFIVENYNYISVYSSTQPPTNYFSDEE